MNQLLEKLDKLEEFAGLPALVLDLMGLISQHNTTTQDLVKRLELDAALTTFLLRQCNSAAYGIREEIRSIPHAVALLGFSKLKIIFSDYMMRNLYRLGQASSEQTNLWKHASAVAIMNRNLADQLSIPVEEAYLAGLLHDIGRLALYYLDKNRFFYYQQVWDEQKTADPTQLERKLFGHSHDQIGNLLLERWGLSDFLKEVVRYHHNALRYQGQNRIVALTALCNTIVHNLYDEYNQSLNDLMQANDLSIEKINKLLPLAMAEIELAWSMVE